MLLWLWHHLPILWPHAIGFDSIAWDKITPRAAMAAASSFLLAVLLGPRSIRWLRSRFREPNKSDSSVLLQLHANKDATPTMGGLFIMAGVLAALLVFGDWNNGYIAPVAVVACGLLTLGIVDDAIKLRREAKGLSARKKLLGQCAIALVAAWLLYRQQAAVPDGLLFSIPFTSCHFALGLWFIPLASLVIVSSSNAVNLADGLDGLAGGCLICATIAVGVLVYAGGHAEWAEYLHVPRIPHAGEMTVLAGAMIGGVLGFLWFNCHPAQVFMGNTGSLPLGGLLGALAVIARQELLLIVIGAVFVAEAASVILQVGYFKWRGLRLFRCAPLHHHFQFLGWPENKIVVRFWIASALCALASIAFLRVGTPDANLAGDAYVLEDRNTFSPSDGCPPEADLDGFNRRMDLPSREPGQAMRKDLLQK